MTSAPKDRVVRAGGAAAAGAAMAVVTGSTPIGVALVACIGAVLGWLLGRRSRGAASSRRG